MAKHIFIDCTLIKNHPDRQAYMDYLVGHKFIHNLDNLPDGIFSGDKDGYLDYVINQISLDNILVPIEHDSPTEISPAEMAVLINMDCTRIELLINADGSESRTIERSIARKALIEYLRHLNLKSKDSVVFHLGGVLRDAFQENWGELPLEDYTIADTPFHGDTIANILNNISIHRYDGAIENIIMKALGITREQAKFDHVFYPDTKSADDADDIGATIYDTHFTYRCDGLTLTLTADENGHQNIKVQGHTNGTPKSVEIPDIHDLKFIIDREFFENAPVEAPKEKPEAPVEAPNVEPDLSVTIKANAYIDSFHRIADEIIARTEKGKNWLLEFSKAASPKEMVGYYFYTYGISKALEKWKKNSKCARKICKNDSERTEIADEVDKIFDYIFCPFCKQGKPVKFDSSNDMYLKRCDLHDNKVDCYAQGDSYVGTMVFPNCPLCGGKLEAAKASAEEPVLVMV